MAKELENENKQSRANIEKIKSWMPFTMGELSRMKLPKNLFLVDGLIPKQGLVAITGHPGSCKSWVLLHIAQCVANGKPVFDKFETEKGNVLMVDEESGIYEISKRIKMTKPKLNAPVQIFVNKGIKVDNPEHLQEIIKIIQEKQIRLVFFDPFISIHNKPENSSDEMQRVIEALRKLTVEGVAVVFAHHNRKDQVPSKSGKYSSQSMRGSTVLWAGVNSHVDIVKGEEDESKTVLTFNQSKFKNDKPIRPFTIKMVKENDVIHFDYIGESSESLSRREKVEKHILQRLTENKELRIEDLVDKNLAGKGLFEVVLEQLKTRNIVTFKKIARGRKMFSKIG